MKDHKALIEFVTNRFAAQKTSRAWVDRQLQRISDLVYIHKGDFTVERWPGTITTTVIYDNTAIEAASRLASYIHGGLTNTSSKWFGLAIRDSIEVGPNMTSWLDAAANTMLEDFASADSGFSAAMHEFFLSLVTLGTSCMFVEDTITDGVRFSNIHLSEIYILEDSCGRVDTVFRKFKLTIRQAVDYWGVDVVHPSLVAKLDKSPDEVFDVLHAVMPRMDYGDGAYEKFNYDSIYIDMSNMHLIKRGNFYELPYVVARFSKRTGEVYGRSPAWDALPAIQMVNQMSKELLRAQQFKNLPPMLVADDGVMMPLNIIPNGIIMGGVDPVTGANRIQPLPIGGSLQESMAMIERTTNIVKETFFVDQLYFKDGTPITATEAVQRQEERSRSLTPHINRTETEALSPLIKIVFNINLRSGRLGKPPMDITGEHLKVEYLSPVAKLNKMADVQAVQRWLSVMLNLVQIDPTVLDPIDLEAVSRYAAECNAVPGFLFRSEDDLIKLKKGRAQQQQMQQNVQMAQLANNINQPIQ